MIGLVMAGLVAAIMSHISGSLNSCSTIATVDFYVPYIRKNASEKEAVVFGKLVGAAIVVIAVLWAWLMVGHSDKPVLLKRGPGATVEELLMSAEYILSEGNSKVILCERGVRGFAKRTRYTLDLAAVPNIQGVSHLPILVDPSHATGRRDLVTPMALAAVAAGAQGLMIEVHPDPEKALSDGPQQLVPDEFDAMMKALVPIAKAVGRTLETDAKV